MFSNKTKIIIYSKFNNITIYKLITHNLFILIDYFMIRSLNELLKIYVYIK